MSKEILFRMAKELSEDTLLSMLETTIQDYRKRKSPDGRNAIKFAAMAYLSKDIVDSNNGDIDKTLKEQESIASIQDLFTKRKN